MSLCLSAAGKTIALALEAFSLVWTHSVEKTEWREDWRVADGLLVIERAHVQGTGAGMEIPAGAEMIDGAWVYEPSLPPRPSVFFSDAGQGSDWQICAMGRCRTIGSLVAVAGSTLEMKACDEPGQPLFDD
ncbi:DUF1850 domain-containing protein [Rhizobium sp. EC-SD404]|uniref:DUF1850 domain-containing protein n=1 Tax=Rhizobium sp. EC-SD404 TaxID=2038389 RepID=UPI00125694A5|nr:DUF1850 domain-containing protein [Rhizobium sp. EC-SD404]VVT18671.1 conserved hypothetical protein [Rhizobium sp. EC-SD404]